MKADLILKSNYIFTGETEQTVSGAVAVKGNRILAVGEDWETYQGPDTVVKEYGDQLIMPAFIDSHMHYFSGALSASDHMCTDIIESTSEKECVEMIKAYAKSHPDERCIRGMGWFPANWNDADLPTKVSLDEAVSDRPVYLLAADAHTMWLNSRGLEEAGIRADWKPASGSVGTFSDGTLNGLLFEPDAYKPALEKMMEMDEEQMECLHKEFMAKLNRCGITSVSEMTADDYDEGTENNYMAMKRLEDKGEMTCRLHLFAKLDGYTDFSKALAWKEKYCSEKLRFSGVKGLLDGVTSTFTGQLLEPYEDRPDTCGIGVPLATFEENESYVLAANRAGLPVRLHCIADGSVRMALDLFERSREVNGEHGLHNTIEHIETIHPSDIGRFAELDVIPSMQPYHLTLDANEKIRRVGEKRCRWEWPHKTILKQGGKLALGTDFPVVSFDPFPNIYAAVTRCDDEGTPTGVNPEECITMGQTLKAYTASAAAVYSREDIGVLAQDKLADIIVLDRNLLTVPAEEIQKTSVVLTVMDGKVVFEK